MDIWRPDYETGKKIGEKVECALTPDPTRDGTNSIHRLKSLTTQVLVSLGDMPENMLIFYYV